MHFDMVGEHADQEVGSDPGHATVMDGADFEVGRLHRPERPLDPAQALVCLDDVGGGHLLFQHIGPNAVKPVQCRLGGDGAFPALPEEGALTDPQFEVLAHFALVKDALGASPDRVGASKRPPVPADRRGPQGEDPVEPVRLEILQTSARVGECLETPVRLTTDGGGPSSALRGTGRRHTLALISRLPELHFRRRNNIRSSVDGP